jgi:hypothetical protein
MLLVAQLLCLGAYFVGYFSVSFTLRGANLTLLGI